MIGSDSALVVVDIQNDFMPGGALAVPGGNDVIGSINCTIECFELVIASQDWHPRDHCSFVSQHPGKQVGDIVNVEGILQRLWPDHCVQNTGGALFAPQFDTRRVRRVIQKGVDRRFESYSTLFDLGGASTGLLEYLRELGVRSIYLAGVATDYCVRFTAEDGIDNGLEVVILRDCCRAIERAAEDAVWTKLLKRGVRISTSIDLRVSGSP